MKSSQAAVSQPQAFSFPSLGKHTLIYGVGILANKAVAFVLLPIYTRFLTPEDYGVLQLISLILEVAAITAGARLAQGVYHFYHAAESKVDKSKVLITATALSVLTFGCVALLGFSVSSQIAGLVFQSSDPYAYYVRIAVAAMAFESLIVVPLAYLQLADRSKLFVFVQLAKLVIQASLNILLVVFVGLGVSGVLWSGLIANISIGSFLCWILIRNHGYVGSAGVAGRLIKYGYPLVITQVATMMLLLGDRFFLNRVAGQAAVGLYGLAYQFALIVTLVAFVPFEQVWRPKRFEVAKRSDREVIFQKAFTYLNVGLCLGAVGVSLFSWDIIRIMADPSFHPAAMWVGPITFLCILQAWTSFHNMGLMVTERTGWYAVANWAGAIVALAGFVFLVPVLEILGAILSVGLALVVRLALVYGLGTYFWPIRYRWKPTLWCGVTGIVLVLVGQYFRPDGIAASVAWSSVLTCLCLACLWVFPVLGREEKKKLKSTIRAGLRGAVRLIVGGRT